MTKLVFPLLLLLILDLPSALFGDVISNLPDTYVEIPCVLAPCAVPRDHSALKCFQDRRLPDHGLAEKIDTPRAFSAHGTELLSAPNWSGYLAETKIGEGMPNSVTQICGSWMIPPVLSPASGGFSFVSASPWVGIDGWDGDSQTIEQLGTDSDWQDGAPYYYVWFEMYPGPTYQVLKADNVTPFPIEPGDLFTAEVIYLGTEAGKATFLLSMVNHTKQVYAIMNVKNTRTSMSPIMTSAEWILEAENSGTSSSTFPLANFGQVTFFDCYATINGVYGPINDPSWKNGKITMYDELTMHPKDEVSPLDPTGTSFTLTWLEQGA